MSVINKLKVVLWLLWAGLLLGMALAYAWQHDWFMLFWVTLFAIHVGTGYKNNLKVTFVNKTYNVTAVEEATK